MMYRWFFCRSTIKVFAEDSLTVAERMTYLFDRVENIVGKGENAVYQHFLLFPQCFSKDFFPGFLNLSLLGEMLKYIQNTYIPAFSPFPTTFSSLPKTNCTIWATLKLSSAKAFNFDKVKICQVVKGNRPLFYSTLCFSVYEGGG